MHIICMMISLAVLIEHRLVTDGRTDGQTEDHSIYHASIVKNMAVLLVYTAHDKRLCGYALYKFTTATDIEIAIIRLT